MSVPLDRLYNYFDDLVDCDLIIYRYYPHGSKNLSDLCKLRPYSSEDTFCHPIMVCCDQEPLDVDTMFDPDTVIEITKNRWRQMCGIELSPEVLRFIVQKRGPMFLNNLNVNDHLILLHSEKNSDQVRIAEEQGAVPVYTWTHGFLSRDWFRYAEDAPRLNYLSEIPKFDFLVYNRAWTGTREYRLKFLELILEKNLLPYTKIKFNPEDQNVHYTNHRYLNAAFKIQRKDLENYVEKNESGPCSSADFSIEDYQQIGVEVVLETLFDDSRHQLTEKSLRPIACGRPFITVSTPGSLQYLRSYGFRTFHPYINEYYDTVLDPLQRLQAVIEEMQRVTKLSIDKKIELFRTLNKIADFNKQRFFSNGFQQQLVREYQEGMSEAIDLISHFRSGHTIIELGSLLQKYHKDDIGYHNHPMSKLINQYRGYAS